MTLPNPIPALRSIFLADPNLSSLVASRVYGQELINAATNAQLGSVLIEDSGGRDVGTKVYDNQIDLSVFAETPALAKDIHAVCVDILKHLTHRAVNDVIIYSADILAGPRYDRDINLKAPYYYSVWSIKTSYMSMS